MTQTSHKFIIYSILIIFLFQTIESSKPNGRAKKLLPRCERLMAIMSSIPPRNLTTTTDCKQTPNKELNLFQEIKSLNFNNPTFSTMNKPYVTLGNQYSDQFEIRAIYTSSGLKMCFEPLLDEINSKDPAVFITI